MIKRTVGIAAALALTSACSSESDTCSDTYSHSGDELTYSTDCERPIDHGAEPDDGLVEHGDAVCTETYTISCDDELGCRDVHTSTCPTPTQVATGGELGQLESALIVANCRKPDGDITVSAFRQVGIPTSGPWPFAVARFNSHFDDGFAPAVRIRDNVARADNAVNDIRDIRTAARHPTDDGIAGVAECQRDSNGYRRNCILTLFEERTNEYARAKGSSTQMMQMSVALHELGHAACIDHYNINTDQPHVIDAFTAMNNYALTDPDSSAADYFRLSDAEKADARRAIF